MILLSLLLFLSACSHEDKIYRKTLNLSEEVGVFTCLKNTPRYVLEYIESKGDKKKAENLDKAFDCIISTNYIIIRHIRGSQKEQIDQFHREEFRLFVNRIFFKGMKVNPISEELFRSLMSLKVFFVGGSVDILTKDELFQLNYLTTFLKQQVQILTSYMKLYLSDCAKTSCHFEKAFLKESLQAILTVALNFRDRFQDHDVNLDLSEINLFFIHLQKNYGGNFEGLFKLFPTFISIKAILLAHKGPVIKIEQLPLFWNILFSVLSTSVEYNFNHQFTEKGLPFDPIYLLKKKGFYNERVHLLVEKVFSLIKEARFRHKNEMIPHKYFEDFIDSFFQHSSSSYHFSERKVSDISTLLRKTYRNFVDILLHPEKPSTKEALDKEALDYLYKEYLEFYNFYKYTKNNFNDLCLMPEGIQSSYDHVIQCKVKLLKDTIGRFYLTQDRRVQYNLDSLNDLNLYRAMIRFILRVYSKDKDFDMEEKRLEIESLKEFVFDFKDFLKFLGFVNLSDRDNLDTPVSYIYNISNLFLSTGNGDHFLQFSEGVNLFHYFLGLKNMTNYFFVQALETCGNLEEKTITINCFVEAFKRYYQKFIDNLPNMLAYYIQLDELFFTSTNAPLDRMKFYNDSMMLNPISGNFNNDYFHKEESITFNYEQNDNGEWCGPFEVVGVENQLSCHDFDRQDCYAFCNAILKVIEAERFSENKSEDKIVTQRKIKEQFIVYLSDLIKRSKRGKNIKAEHLNDAFSYIFLVEVFLGVYDKNKDGVIDKEEAFKAYPKFKKNIKSFLPRFMRSDSLAKYVFIYILDKGTRPSPIKIFFMWLGLYRNSSNIQADRLQLIKALSSF